MRILITGSAGFVGSHLVEHLIANTDWDIIGIDSFRHKGDSMRILHNDRYKIFCHDLTAPISERMSKAIGPVDYIINMASESHVDRSITDPVPFVENNVSLVLNVLEFARKQTSLQKFIQISTDEVYGAAPGNISHKEWSSILPSNPYAASKAAQEAIAISYWRSYDIPLIITNTMNMFGERQDSEKFIPMVILGIHNGGEITIHGNKDFIGSRYYLHARNFADALLFVLKDVAVVTYKDSSELILPKRINIAGECEVDNLTMAQSVASVMGKELRYKLVDFHAARPGHDRRYALDSSLIRSMGWKQPLNMHESLKKTIEWTLARKEWL